MKTIQITIAKSACSYPIFIGNDMLVRATNLINAQPFTHIAIVSDENIAALWLQKLLSALPGSPIPIILAPGEKEKNIDTVQKIWTTLLTHKFDRSSLVINLGGGVIGDIGGFAAATYMRGIPFVHIPTSITAQADAMIGGKVGINFGNLKNYIGVFQQPIAVIVDTNTLTTLPKRAFTEGFGEIIKHGLIYDSQYFRMVTEKSPLDFLSSELPQIIARSIEIKGAVIQADEKETGLRKILNFGHTVGHAVESLSQNTPTPLLHGEAVHIGMVAETNLSVITGMLSKEAGDTIQKALQQTGLPTKVHAIALDAIDQAITFDKKTARGHVQWTLLKEVGQAVIDQEIPQDVVHNALKSVID